MAQKFNINICTLTTVLYKFRDKRKMRFTQFIGILIRFVAEYTFKPVNEHILFFFYSFE